MKELTEIAVENGELLTRMLQNMHKSSQLMLETLARMEDRANALDIRCKALEERTTLSFDPRNLIDDQLRDLGEEMYERGGLKETIREEIDRNFESEVQDLVANYVSNLDIEVEVEATLKDRN